MTPRTWDIIGKRKWGYAISVLLIVPGLVALIVNVAGGQGALNWGVDFTGGNYFQLKLQRAFSTGDIRALVDRFATGQSIIQKADQEVFIRTRPLSPDNKGALLAAIRRNFGTVTVLREDQVGPKIGRELRNVAIIAVVLGLLLQVLYIAFRFKSIRYAVTADAALLHDLLVVVGIFAITRTEVNSAFVAVLLTVVGYSINDTIVVFDRVRENLTLRTKEPFDRLVNRSLLEVMVRSVVTGISALFALAAIYVFGGVTIRDFAFGLMVGILTGSYSSIFNASALLVDWHLWSDRRAGGRRQDTQEAPAVSVPSPVSVPGEPPVAARSAQGSPPARRRRSRRR
ncbi:MAG: protein translocase subunit SecF [Armatimonadota bacterium]